MLPKLANIKSWFDNLYKDSKPITDADLKAAKKARMDLWRSKPELISVPISELKQRKIAILLCWSLEMDAGETRQVEKLDEPLLKFKNVDYYVETRQHASEYPYEYLAITFQTDKARSKLLRDHGVQRFPLQRRRTVNFKSSTEYIIFALDLEETDFACGISRLERHR